MVPITYVEDATLYAIKTVMPSPTKITIGKLGTFLFEAGMYVYVGSAKRNIKSRIERHLKLDKKFHWHFDYFRPYVEVVEVQTFAREEECALFQRLKEANCGDIPVEGFGSSDCTCSSHLFYVPV